MVRVLFVGNYNIIFDDIDIYLDMLVLDMIG